MLLWGILSLLRTGHHFPGGDRVVSPGDPVRLPKPVLWSCLITTGNAGSIAARCLKPGTNQPHQFNHWEQTGRCPSVALWHITHSLSGSPRRDVARKKGMFPSLPWDPCHKTRD